MILLVKALYQIGEETQRAAAYRNAESVRAPDGPAAKNAGASEGRNPMRG